MFTRVREYGSITHASMHITIEMAHSGLVDVSFQLLDAPVPGGHDAEGESGRRGPGHLRET